MYSNMTNLLPPERRRLLVRDYRVRLAVVALSFIIVLTCIAAILLLPTYIFLTKKVSTSETRLAGIESTLTSSDEKSLSVRLAALTNNVTALGALGNVPSASAFIRDALAVPHTDISISSIAYVPAMKIQYKKPVGSKPGTLTIVGVAATRDALRNYQLALQNAPFAQSVNLPVSAYAQDIDITFTITITLAP